jgi:sulfotransferase family protein
MATFVDRHLKPYVRALKYDRLYRRAIRSAADTLDGPPTRLSGCIFVVGCGRSGTSLLGNLLALHPDVRYIREPYHLWAVVDAATDATNLYVRGDGRCRMDATDVDDGVRARFVALFGAPGDARSLVEKTPHNALRIGFLESLTEGARYVHIVRDGTAVARSIASLAAVNAYRVAGRPDYNQWWGVKDAKWRNLARDGAAAGYHPDEVRALRGDRQRATYEWLVSLSEVDRHRAELGDRLVEVTYEALTADPATELARLHAALGMPQDEAWLDSAVALVHPARTEERDATPLPPSMAATFDAFAERYGFPGRAVPDPAVER